MRCALPTKKNPRPSVEQKSGDKGRFQDSLGGSGVDRQRAGRSGWIVVGIAGKLDGDGVAAGGDARRQDVVELSDAIFVAGIVVPGDSGAEDGAVQLEDQRSAVELDRMIQIPAQVAEEGDELARS